VVHLSSLTSESARVAPLPGSAPSISPHLIAKYNKSRIDRTLSVCRCLSGADEALALATINKSEGKSQVEVGKAVGLCVLSPLDTCEMR